MYSCFSVSCPVCIYTYMYVCTQRSSLTWLKHWNGGVSRTSEMTVYRTRAKYRTHSELHSCTVKFLVPFLINTIYSENGVHCCWTVLMLMEEQHYTC